MLSLLGSVLGFGNSFLPSILGFFEKGQSNKHELKMLEAHDPFICNTIKWYEKQLQIVGSDTAKRHPHWGQSVGAENAIQQTTFGDFEINEDYCGESCEVS
mgnify:CR=1 FL=1